MNTATHITQSIASAQAAAQIHIFPAQQAEKHSHSPFADNLDHLKSLELEASLTMAAPYMRRNRNGLKENEEYCYPSFPLITKDTTEDDIQSVLENVVTENRRREKLSVAQGIQLNFIVFSSEWDLDPFERSVVMLLLMRYIAPDFIALFNACDFERKRGTGIEIGTLLSLLCRDLGNQLEHRRYFSVIAPLMRNDILAFNGSIDDTTNILDEKVCLNERIVRYILGDNNLYNTCFRYIKQEKCNVKLDQVILAEHLKENIVTCIDRYLSGRESGIIKELDDFYGYGTALALLFHGPSGTGKTMLARAIATRFNRPVYSLTAHDLRTMPGGYDEILGTLFREATLQGAIVFLDECDDVFENDSPASRALLIEIEKAHCIVILATNKPIDLDPALERRLTMKIHFPIPEADKRLEMWQALIPPVVELADDVNLEEFAERYQFSGGLIRNSIFLAVTYTKSNAERPLLTAAELHQASSLQISTLSDEQNICRTYTPDISLDKLPLKTNQRNEIRNIAKVWQSLHERKIGLSIILSAADIATAVQAAEGLARECELKIRAFDYQKVISFAETNKIVDPATQRKILPLDYAFSSAGCDAAITMFIDYEGKMDAMLEKSPEKFGDILMSELLTRVRNNTGFFCIVTKNVSSQNIPTEFSLMINIERPSEEIQLRHWESHLGTLSKENERFLLEIVEDSPMHLTEIDYIVKQAGILATIRRMETIPSKDEIHEVLSRHRKKRITPLLFGRE